MSNRQCFDALRDRVQQDVGNRGLARDPQANLFNACPDDLHRACQSIAQVADPLVAVVTGFYIPTASPPAFETDGPLGAVFLARTLVPLGVRVVLMAEPGCQVALRAGLAAAGREDVPVADLPGAWPAPVPAISFLVALEVVGPNHTEGSIRTSPGASPATVEAFLAEVPPQQRDRCYSMRGRDITVYAGPAPRLFEPYPPLGRPWLTIGIGDGGNEIGMGKVPWEVVRCNIPRGGLIACRIPTDYLVVAGVSNWGAYALAAGVALLRRGALPPDLLDPDREADILRAMVEHGPLVDGVTGQPSLSVDGLPLDEYVKPLIAVGRWLEEAR
jgi:hypothetical protein